MPTKNSDAPFVDAEKAIAVAIARFPETFGLRAFPGETFRISQAASFLRDRRDAKSVQLYTQRLKGDTWLDFSRGSEPELRRNLVELKS